MGAGFSTVTPSGGSVNVTSVAQAVWSYSPRSLTDIQSLAAAIQNNNPSLLSTLSDILYVPAPFFAGQVSATQVAAFLDNLILNYGLAGPVAVAISASPYGLWSTNFVTQVIPYLSSTSIAQVLFSDQMDANHAQLILYTLAQNYDYNMWLQLITYNMPTSVTFLANVTLSTNVLIAQNITIASGVTVTCGAQTCFFVAQSFNNYGTIVNPYGAPGGTTVSGNGAGFGGTGGGGVVIIGYTVVIGTINVNGNAGNNGYGSSTTGGNGNPGGIGVFAIVPGITVPLGGTAQFGSVSGPNGGGGGGAAYGAGTGGVSVVYSFANGNALITYIMQGVSDWWLSEVEDRIPASVTPLLFIYGSGGGGGGGVGSAGATGGGGGGGGGGEVIVYGYNVVAGSISAVGGTGGGSYLNGGGGGGGGGVVLVFYGPGGLNGTMSLNLVGGAGGVASGTSARNGLAGQTGVYLATSVTVNG